MTDEEMPAAIEAYYKGDKPVVSAGGYVASFVIPFDEIHIWRAIAKDWTPDNPVTFFLARAGRPSRRFDPKTKEWLANEG